MAGRLDDGKEVLRGRRAERLVGERGERVRGRNIGERGCEKVTRCACYTATDFCVAGTTLNQSVVTGWVDSAVSTENERTEDNVLESTEIGLRVNVRRTIFLSVRR